MRTIPTQFVSFKRQKRHTCNWLRTKKLHGSTIDKNSELKSLFYHKILMDLGFIQFFKKYCLFLLLSWIWSTKIQDLSIIRNSLTQKEQFYRWMNFWKNQCCQINVATVNSETLSFIQLSKNHQWKFVFSVRKKLNRLKKHLNKHQ